MTTAEKQTQEQIVLEHILTHGSLTRLESVTELGVFELAARINGLEKKGYVFKKIPETFTTKSGRVGHCKRYELEAS